MERSGLGTVKFKGKSGKRHCFIAYPFDTDFEAEGAVYFVTNRVERLDGIGGHTQIYIGQTSNLSERFGKDKDKHQHPKFFDQNNANCICVLLEPNEKKRLEIESDLCANYDLLHKGFNK